MKFQADIRLWCSVILRAIADVDYTPRSPTPLHLRKRKPSNSTVKRQELNFKEAAFIRKDAQDWLNSTTHAPHSFEWVCDVCGLDARTIRERARTKEGREWLLNSRPYEPVYEEVG